MALIVTPSKTVYRFGEELVTFHAEGNDGGVLWTTDKGSLLAEIGLDNSLEMPNQSWYGLYSPVTGNKAVKVTAQDNSTLVDILVDSYAVFPFESDWGFQSPINDDTEISMGEDKSESYYIKSDLFGKFPLVYSDREWTEYLQALVFYAFHRRSRWFYLDEGGTEEIQFGRFDSEFVRQPDWADGKGYSFTYYCPDWKLPPEALELGSSLLGELIPGIDLLGG